MFIHVCFLQWVITKNLSSPKPVFFFNLLFMSLITGLFVEIDFDSLWTIFNNDLDFSKLILVWWVLTSEDCLLWKELQSRSLGVRPGVYRLFHAEVNIQSSNLVLWQNFHDECKLETVHLWMCQPHVLGF